MSDKLIDRQRDYLKRLSDMYDRYKAKPIMEKTCGFLKSVLQGLQNQQKRFYERHEEILDFVSENSLISSDVPYLSEGCLDQFDDIFFTFKGKVLDDLQKIPVTSSEILASTFVASQSRSEAVEAKLPKISLPKFSDDYMDWVPFKDVYKSLVHDVPLLSKIQKFHYLKGTLSGEAANLIKVMAITESNYDSAWQILEKRYNNKRLIVENLIKNICSMPDSDGSVKSIKLILDTSEECLASLKNIEIDTSNWDPILIYLISQTLDMETRRKWQSSLKSSTDVPKLVELFSFLENWFHTLESLLGCTADKDKGKRSNLNPPKVQLSK